MGFEETELRLGLPGNNSNKNGTTCEGEVVRKRVFSETTNVDLKLNLSSSNNNNNKEAKEADNSNINNDSILLEKGKNLLPVDPEKPPAKAQVVGWPPVRSFRKNVLATQKSNTTTTTTTTTTSTSTDQDKKINIAVLVKVSMDGAPYLRKVDLKIYNSYHDLSLALSKMFSSFTINGNCGAHGMKDFMNESKLMDVLNSSDYVPTYEDKDGDWMLVGDVPWEMFVESCKRLRIMKGKEAVGLAPRAMEKCKNRS